jgi:MFS family permease
MVYSILALAGISIMFFGYEASVMSQVNSNPDYLRLMGADSGSGRDAAAVGGLVSLWFGGFAIGNTYEIPNVYMFLLMLDGVTGAILIGAYADKIGRLRSMQLGCLWAILGGALQASAQNITWMAFARVLGGIGCGHLNTIVPIWTSELADPHLRGTFVAVEFTLAITGSTM